MQELKTQLEAAGSKVVEVIRSDSSLEPQAGFIRLEPNEPTSYEQLLNLMQELEEPVTSIIYGWSAQTYVPDWKALQDYSALNEDYDVVHQLLATVLAEWEADIDLVFLTHQNQNVIHGAEKSSLHDHTVALMNVASQEMSPLRTAYIDLDTQESPKQTASRLLQELSNRQAHAHQEIAYRNGRRWLPYFETISFDHADPQPRKLGTCLVTGTLDKTEYFLIRHLLETYQAKVILLYPQEMETLFDQEWKQESEALKRLGDFQLVGCDYSNQQQLQKTIQGLTATRPLDGWIHALKNSDEKNISLVETTNETIVRAHFDTHVASMMKVFTQLREQQPGFVRVMSSLSSFVGGISYGAYSSSHALMDSLALLYAREATAREGGWSVINLDRVSDEDNTWLGAQEITAAFDLSMEQPELRQLVVSNRDVNELLLVNKTDHQETNTKAADFNRALVTSEFQSAETDTERTVVGLVEALFGFKGIGIADDFFDMGGDSLKAMMLINKLKKQEGITLEISDIFSNAVLKDLAELIDERKWLIEDEELENELVI